MISIRRAADRGEYDHGWLHTRHTFSFGEYRDPAHMRFRSLRVINEDTVRPAEGFGTHQHRDMEIVTYVLAGKLEHRDSLGNGAILQPGELQRMSAGTGIEHSEFNPSADEPVHFYQIWIFPAERGVQPSYEQKSVSLAGHGFRLVASPEEAEERLFIGQDARIYLAKLKAAEAATHEIASGRHAWLQVLRGAVRLDGDELDVGDGAALSDESRLSVTQSGDAEAELMLFDLA